VEGGGGIHVAEEAAFGEAKFLPFWVLTWGPILGLEQSTFLDGFRDRRISTEVRQASVGLLSHPSQPTPEFQIVHASPSAKPSEPLSCRSPDPVPALA
jgi:hypothetical protein